MEINRFFIPSFRAKKQNFTFKGVTSGDDLYTDEEGRHLIFRNIGGRTRPIRVGAEDYAEWLANQNVDIDPADQKTLREIDDELEIMERAAEYGGPALQKQYEDYFKKRREQYGQLAGKYYQQALQNQAVANNMSVEQLTAKKKDFYESSKQDTTSRSAMPKRGWDTSFKMWVDTQDERNNLTPSNDDWYYNRIYGIILTKLIDDAEKGTKFSDIDMDKVFSNEFIQSAIASNYGSFFGGQKGVDPKKVIGAVKSLQLHYKEGRRDDRQVLNNFIGYWYDRMEKDFLRENQMKLATSPETTGVLDVPENVIPKELPKDFSTKESDALMSMYRRSPGSKLNAAHRVMLHGMSRLVNSVPKEDMVKFFVALADGNSGIHAAHKEGYERAFSDNSNLGIVDDRESILDSSLQSVAKVANGTTSQKISALKRLSMAMGMIDGYAVISSNPGITKSNYTRKWNDSAINAGRAKSEGPGLIDALLDDDSRNRHIYKNEHLKIIHTPKKEADYKKNENAVDTKKPSSTESTKEPTIDTSDTSEELVTEGKFRVPLFDFPASISKVDREFLDDLSSYIDKSSISLEKIGPSIYRIKNPQNDQYIDLLYNNNKNSLIGVSRDENNKIVPITSLSVEEVEKTLG